MITKNNIIATAAGWLFGLLPILVSAYIAYDLYSRGPTPEKRLQLIHLSARNPVKELSTLDYKVKLALTVENTTADNIVIVHDILENSGRAPILPSDFFEKLSVNVVSPWRIISVDNAKYGIQFDWKRVTDTRFEAAPALLNPSDNAAAIIYLTNTKGVSDFGENTKDPEVEWKARILNMRGFTTKASIFDFTDPPGATWFPVRIELEGIGILFLIVTALGFEGLYLRLLSNGGYLVAWNLRSIAIVLGISLLSFSVAEALTSYLFPTWLIRVYRSNWLNLTIILGHMILLTILWRRNRRIDSLSPT